MKALTYFIAGVIFASLISASSASLTIVKLQNPKQVIVKSFNSDWRFESTIASFIRSKVKEGFVTKSIAIASGSTSDHRAILIMEKY